MSATPAWIELAGAVNVRDVGGLPTVDGHTIRSGVLIRADNLQGLTKQDVATLLTGHGVRTVVDLRTDGEAHLEGPGPLVGRVPHHHLSLIREQPGEPDQAEVDRAVAGATAAVPSWEDRSARRGEDSTDMTGYYLGYVQDAPDNVAAALRVVGEPGPGAAIVHCAAGKDRTGTVVALALSLAGVPREEVVADYVASAERIEAILARLRASPTYASDLERATAADIIPQAGSMERFLDEVDARYGGVHALAASIGLTEEEVAALVARLVRR